MREDEGGERETVEFSLSMSMERVRVCVRVHTGPVNTLLRRHSAESRWVQVSGLVSWPRPHTSLSQSPLIDCATSTVLLSRWKAWEF